MKYGRISILLDNCIGVFKERGEEILIIITWIIVMVSKRYYKVSN